MFSITEIMFSIAEIVIYHIIKKHHTQWCNLNLNSVLTRVQHITAPPFLIWPDNLIVTI